jgi:anaerobic magnesium-protoporphyrin IX monomethyl ester cyclase
LELISAGAVAREWNGAEVTLVDAIAEKLDTVAVTSRIRAFAPDIILSITGFECFGEDMDALRELKGAFPSSQLVLFGHYATHFPKETLAHSGADFIILGEPELIFSDLLKALDDKLPLGQVMGIVHVKSGELTMQGSGNRIPNPNDLPMPALDLLPQGRSYYEPLMAEPYGMIQSARGCPYQCNYCVKSYGSKLTELTPERIIGEMREWKRLFGVRSIRFIDDTFTINRRRVLEICDRIAEADLGVSWACLSRTDNLDCELLIAMKRSGCVRIYFGMESGSQRMLRHLPQAGEHRRGQTHLPSVPRGGHRDSRVLHVGPPG